MTNNSFGGTSAVNFLTAGMNRNVQNLETQPFIIDQAAINRAAQQILNNSLNMQQIITAQQLPVTIPQNVAVQNQNLNGIWHPSPPNSEDEEQRKLVGVTIKEEVDRFGQGNGATLARQNWSSLDIKKEFQEVNVKFKPKARPRTIALCSLGPNLCSAPFYKYSLPLKVTHCTKCWSTVHTFCFNNTNRATNEQIICCDGRMNYRAAEFFDSHRSDFLQKKSRKM
ncbi:hypothetical protein CAEBREN_22965 [Caenorhabditis brenneri]|uniref:Uncharacterized protein n=1 Tax=Caenorhabditis brenneri TaxID=135651 RepID=G0MHA2_CAEBE|nr:hypothetical protein CAEBREN_22965 [Caenorhabditis brenneri]